MDIMDTTEIITHTIETVTASLPEALRYNQRVLSALETVAKTAYTAGRDHALTTIMTADQVAAHFGISLRRAQALIANRHARFGTGAKIGRSWCIIRDELDQLAPDEKFRS